MKSAATCVFYVDGNRSGPQDGIAILLDTQEEETISNQVMAYRIQYLVNFWAVTQSKLWQSTCE